MNSAPSKMNSAPTDTSEEIRNSAECTALRAITVNKPARIAEIEKIQKKTVSQPERIIADFQLPIADLRSSSMWPAAESSSVTLQPRFATAPLSSSVR